MKPTLCLDFDGVIHSYTSGWKGIDQIPDPPVVDIATGQSAIEKLYEYIEHFHVCIYSTRSETQAGREAMKDWLGHWDATYWREHPNQPQPRTALLLCIDFPAVKPPALVGIDDRVVTFTGVFPEAKILLDFKPWSKKEQP